MIVAYLRVSTEKQQVANQKAEISRYAKEKGIKVDHWLKETNSGKCKKEKRLLGNLLEKLNAGDVLIVTELSRLSRSLYEIMNILNFCLEHKIILYSTKDGYAFDHSLNSKILAFAFGLVAELERNLISLRTREALAARRSKGIKLGRPAAYRPKYYLLNNKIEQIKELLEKGYSVRQICQALGMSRSTFYRYRKYINHHLPPIPKQPILAGIKPPRSLRK